MSKKKSRKRRAAAETIAMKDNDEAAGSEPVVASSSPTDSRMWVQFGRAALVAAVGIAIYLVIVALSQGQVAGCEEGKSCETVLTSKWAKLFGIPVGVFGAGLYLAMTGATFVRGAGAVRLFLTLMIVGGALWFTGIQAFVLKAFCPWCCTAHALASVGAILSVFGLRGERSATSQSAIFLATAGALGALVVTAVAQAIAPEPESVTISAATEKPAVEAPVERRSSINLHDQFHLSTVDLPSMGNAETAKNLAVGIFDFSCSHCRELVKVIKPVVQEFGDELAILKLPGHYNDNGRDIQKLMLPVFREAPAVYDELGEELYAEKIVATVNVVRAELEKRLGKERLEGILAVHADWAEARVNESREVMKVNHAVTKSWKLPQLMVGKTIDAGNKKSSGYYFKMVEDNFGLKREDPPQLECSPGSFELGTVIAYSQHSLEIGLKNPGKDPVKIEGIKSPKGIAIPKLPEFLAPGASHTVKIKVRIPSTKLTTISDHFEVYSDADDAVIRIPISADILNIKVEPRSLNFGSVVAGGPAKELSVRVTLPAPAKPGDVTCPIRFFKPEPAEELEKSRVFLVRAKAQFEAGLTGYRNSAVKVDLIPEDDSIVWPKSLNIPVRARIVSSRSKK